MNNERKVTYEALKSLHQQEHRANRSHAHQNLAIISLMLLAGVFWACKDGSTCRASSPADENRVTDAPSSLLIEASEENQVKWLKDYGKAITLAKKLHRPVLIDFAASWCVPCSMMDKHTWPAEAVREALDSKVIPLRIDMDGKSSARLIDQFKVEFVPTILLVDAEGKVLKREGFVNAEELLKMIRSNAVEAKNPRITH